MQKAPVANQRGLRMVAEWTGLEPATPGVTGRYSNQLNYHSAVAGITGRLHDQHAIKQCTPKLGVP